MILYRVKDWDKIYENNRSRSVKDLAWVAIPNRHDGEGYSMIMAHPKAAEIFTAWILILQVASRCQPRGSLVRDNGRPHTPNSLALKTRAKVEWFSLALEVLVSEEVGWIECVEVAENTGDASDCQPPDSRLAPRCQAGDEEQNRTEGNGTEQNIPPSPLEGGGPSVPVEVEPPPGFPATLVEAKAQAASIGCPDGFVEKTWNKALSRGCRDSKDVPIRQWRAYLATEWQYERERLHREQHRNANRPSTGKPSPNRSAGTANEGKANDYAGLG